MFKAFLRKWGRLVGLVLASFVLVAYTGLTTWPTANQLMARGDLEALEGAGQLIWSGADPGWGTTSAQLATYSDFTTYFKNNGSCGGSSSQIISSTAAQACKVLTSVHTPILANNDFTGGSITSWTSSYTNGTTACGTILPTAYAGVNAAGGSGTGYAAATSGTNAPGLAATQCFTTQTLTQTFTISGTPTSPSGSFMYDNAQSGGTGDATNCSPVAGSVSYALKVNSTTQTLGTFTQDGAWHTITFTPSGLVNGTNTITLTTTVYEGVNQTSHFNSTTQITTCNTGTAANETSNVDDFILTATY